MDCKYVCCKCHKLYDYYECVSENKAFDDMTYEEKEQWFETHPEERKPIQISANCFVFRQHCPVPTRDDEKLNVKDVNGNLENETINLCPDCMRELLLSVNPFNSSENCFDVI